MQLERSYVSFGIDLETSSAGFVVGGGTTFETVWAASEVTLSTSTGRHKHTLCDAKNETNTERVQQLRTH